MIKLTKQDKDKQFISILTINDTPIEDIYKHLTTLYPDLKKILYKKDDTEILFEPPKGDDEEKKVNCSYQDIVKTVNDVSSFAEIMMIVVENGKRLNAFDTNYYELVKCIEYYSTIESRK